MTKIAVILSGCGHLDGSEIRESVLTFLALDKIKAEVECFAPDINFIVKNHLNGTSEQERRNSIIESARITRGDVKNITQLNSKEFDGIILPGGFGAAKNLSNLVISGKNAEVIPELKNALIDFWQTKKPIGAICISPAVVVAALKGYTSATVTLGIDSNNVIHDLGGTHIECAADNFHYDEKNNIFSTPAYMIPTNLSSIALGIEKMVNALIKNSSNK